MRVIASEKPSWTVLVIDETAEVVDDAFVIIAELTLDKADPDRDRIDLVCVSRDSEIVTVKGEVGNGTVALNPIVPQVPAHTKVLAKIDVRGASKFVTDVEITNYQLGTLGTGQLPPIEMENSTLYLDSDDPFDAVLIPLVKLNRIKRQDYGTPDNLYANFDKNASLMNLPGYTALEDALSMVARKLGRITNLRGRDPANETVIDSYQDLAVYAILACGLALREAEQDQ